MIRTKTGIGLAAAMVFTTIFPSEVRAEAAPTNGAILAPEEERGELSPDSPAPFPGDYTWAPGWGRTKDSPLKTKYFTGEFRVDVPFHYSFEKPIDNTISGSSEVFRHGEFQLTQLGIGGDFHV